MHLGGDIILMEDGAFPVSQAGQFQHQIGQAQQLHPLPDGDSITFPIGDQQYPLSHTHGVGHQPGSQLGLAGSLAAGDQQGLTLHQVVDGGHLYAVQRQRGQNPLLALCVGTVQNRSITGGLLQQDGGGIRSGGAGQSMAQLQAPEGEAAQPQTLLPLPVRLGRQQLIQLPGQGLPVGAPALLRGGEQGEHRFVAQTALAAPGQKPAALRRFLQSDRPEQQRCADPAGGDQATLGQTQARPALEPGGFTALPGQCFQGGGQTALLQQGDGGRVGGFQRLILLRQKGQAQTLAQQGEQLLRAGAEQRNQGRGPVQMEQTALFQRPLPAVFGEMRGCILSFFCLCHGLRPPEHAIPVNIILSIPESARREKGFPKIPGGSS